MTLRTDVSALYVDPRGPYPTLLADVWDEKRDANLYDGPRPVVAHPPCQRWGRYWGGGPMLHGTPQQKTLGDDGGCFDAAILTVRTCGGVLEHPEASHAWRAHGVRKPPRWGGWIDAGDGIGWTCCVEQGHYGHRARKATWLYAAHVADLPDAIWGPSVGVRLDEGFHTVAERRAARESGRAPRVRLSTADNIRTPVAFAEWLIELAASARRTEAA